MDPGDATRIGLDRVQRACIGRIVAMSVKQPARAGLEVARDTRAAQIHFGRNGAVLRQQQRTVARMRVRDDAVSQASAYAASDDTVLLAPACASFAQFANYQARGDAFRNAVEALI